MADKELTFSCTQGAREDVVILRLSGPFTLNNMFPLQAEMRTLKPPCLIMDLTDVPYMDSAGMGVIMNYHVAAQDAGHKFFLVGINERLRALIEMTRVDRVLNIRDSVETAEASA
ncbi:putative anti-sigma factor antagonist [Edaphobacter acidisoli]|uniref:Anti-sigma factor antagonist n=1 Tax=Edaphobacter acidisoli TaxID=2040573 RepID=A0A916RH65_9BACT|nr:STAS domain-containing protein [Edaphobacter acidisoli]GGA56259.1 putative anti-sigma factor antagonist [Edaphobacter acidisoli]